jgi:hypothetical protein
MALVLTVGAIIKCTHGGMCKLSQGNSKLTVSGNAVITSGMEAGISFAGGPNVTVPCTFATGAGPSPCTATGPSLPSGVATKLLVDGMGALLAGASGQNVNAQDPSAQWSVVSAGQTLLQAS